jgi:hypothetical protein
MAQRTLERDVQDTEDESAGSTAGTDAVPWLAAAPGVRPGGRGGPPGVLLCAARR